MADILLKSLYLNIIGPPAGISPVTYDTFPDNDDITVTGGVADAEGASVQIVATVGAADVHSVGLYVSNPTVATDYKVTFQTGLAAAEVNRAVVPYTRTDISTAGVHYGVMSNYPYPIRVNSGIRLGALCKDGAGSSVVDVVEFHALGVA